MFGGPLMASLAASGGAPAAGGFLSGFGQNFSAGLQGGLSNFAGNLGANFPTMAIGGIGSLLTLPGMLKARKEEKRRRERAIRLLRDQGEITKENLRSDSREQMGEADQQLMDAGLYSSTVRQGVHGGINRNLMRGLREVDESVANRLAGIEENTQVRGPDMGLMSTLAMNLGRQLSSPGAAPATTNQTDEAIANLTAQQRGYMSQVLDLLRTTPTPAPRRDYGTAARYGGGYGPPM